MSSDEKIVSNTIHELAVPLINEPECQTNEENYAKDNQNSMNYKSDETKAEKSDSLLTVSAPPRRKLNRSGSLRRTHTNDTTDQPFIESNQNSIPESSTQTDSECSKKHNDCALVLTTQSSNDSNKLFSTLDSTSEPHLRDRSTQCFASDLTLKQFDKKYRRSDLPTDNGIKLFPKHPMDSIRGWKSRWFTSDEAKANRRRRLNRCLYYLKVFLTHLFSTTGLCLLVIAYTCMGAFIFTFLESKHEIKQRNDVQIKRIQCANDLWEQTLHFNILYPNEWNETAIERLKKFEEVIIKAVREDNYGGTSDQWTFSGALLYSVTVITTIGYGNVTCKTSWGRIVTMIYALIGIPVMFLCLANLGNLMAETFRFSYKRICCVCFCCCDRLSNNKKHNNKSSLKSQNERIELKNCTQNEKEVKVVFNENDEQKVRSIIALTPSTPPTTSDISSQASSPVKSEISQRNDDLVVIHESRVKVESNNERNNERNDRVPVWLVILLVIGYIMGGASMFSLWEEGWGLLEGAYFCFTTLTTIGFGDLVPGSAKYSDNAEEQTKFIICCAYLIVGLSLLAMSFNLVQEEIVIKSKEIGRRIGIIPQQKECDTSVSL